MAASRAHAQLTPPSTGLRLTVCTPNLNHAEFLPRAIEAIVGQSRPPDEYILIDDGSSDDSVSIMRSYASRHPFIRVIEGGECKGVNARLREALAMASGDMFYGASADDEVMPEFFSEAMAWAERFPECGIVVGDHEMVRVDGSIAGHAGYSGWTEAAFIPGDRYAREVLDVEAPLTTLGAATIYRADAMRAIGSYHEPLGAFADGFAARVLALRFGAVYLARPCVRVTISENSYSRRDMATREATLHVVDEVVRRMRSEELRDVFSEADAIRWETRMRLEVLGDLERVRDVVVPRDLNSVRAAYLDLAGQGEIFDRVTVRVHRLARWIVTRLRHRSRTGVSG